MSTPSVEPGLPVLPDAGHHWRDTKTDRGITMLASPTTKKSEPLGNQVVVIVWESPLWS